METQEQADSWFVSAALDGAQRRTLIEKTARRRRVMGWLATASTILFALSLTSACDSSRNQTVAGFATLVQYMIVLTFGTELRLLKVVDQLLAEREKPKAESGG